MATGDLAWRRFDNWRTLAIISLVLPQYIQTVSAGAPVAVTRPAILLMTFRIQRALTEDAVVLTVSGDIATGREAELRALLDAEIDRPVILDLKDLAVVDRAGLLLLAGCEAGGARLTNCPGYVREWIEREREFAGLHQGTGHLRHEENAMAQVSTSAVEEGRFESAGGLNIFFRSWRPQSTPRGLVVIVPGFNAHSAYYAWVAEQFVADGLAVYALDLRGRGKSDGERFYVEKFADYVSDVAGFVRLAKSREPGARTFLLGHSAGGVVACLYTIEQQAELAGLICESLAHQVPAPDFALAVFKGLAHVAPHAHVLHLKNEDFSRDPGAVAAMNADPLIAHETQPTQTLAEMVRADDRLKKEFPLITLPVLILHGTADKATRPSGSQLFFDTTGSKDKTLKLYDGHFHDLLNDIGKELVIADIKGWIDARLPAVR
jgi:acylglycerol lipase